MGFIENILNTRAGNYIIMITIVVLFLGLLRLLYGPKGFLRKSLWNGIDDDPNEIKNKTHKTENKTGEADRLDNNDSKNSKKKL